MVADTHSCGACGADRTVLTLAAGKMLCPDCLPDPEPTDALVERLEKEVQARTALMQIDVVLSMEDARAILARLRSMGEPDGAPDGWEKHVQYRRTVLCPCGYMAWEYRDTPGRSICTKCGGQELPSPDPLATPTDEPEEGEDE